MNIRADLITNVNFDRRVPGEYNQWNTVEHNVEAYVTSRRPSSSSSRPEIDFGGGPVAIIYEWFWVRMICPNDNIMVGDRMQRLDDDGNVDEDLDDLFILQIDTIAHVQQLILSLREGSA